MVSIVMQYVVSWGCILARLGPGWTQTVEHVVPSRCRQDQVGSMPGFSWQMLLSAPWKTLIIQVVGPYPWSAFVGDWWTMLDGPNWMGHAAGWQWHSKVFGGPCAELLWWTPWTPLNSWYKKTVHKSQENFAINICIYRSELKLLNNNLQYNTIQYNTIQYNTI